MGSYGQFCPVSMACEVLAERWTLLVLRELLCGSRRFNELRRGLPLMSPSLLSKRLQTLERAGIVERQGTDYALTAAGQELRAVVESIGTWGKRWARGALDPERLDASLLMWDMHRRVDGANLPAERVVVQFHLRGSIDAKSWFWLVLKSEEVDLCLADPGFEVDLQVAGHVDAMVRYWTGVSEIDELVRDGALRLEGRRALVRAFPSWFTRSPFAEVEDPRAGSADPSMQWSSTG